MADLTEAELADIIWSAENFIGRAGVGILVTRTEVLALVAEVRRRREEEGRVREALEGMLTVEVADPGHVWTRAKIADARRALSPSSPETPEKESKP